MFLLYDGRRSRPIDRRRAGALGEHKVVRVVAGREIDRVVGPPVSLPREGPTFIRGVTLVGAVALVVGNMVGTSMYTLPASLAQALGPLGIFAWVVTALGDVGVALVDAILGARCPRPGGPYVFAREAFGDFAGFLSVWLYWISALIGNAGIVTGIIAYAEGFVPGLSVNPLLRFGVAQLLLWMFF